MNKLFVSVVIPVNNSEKTIARTIESVLNQTYEDFEIILVDDFSQDNSIEILEKYSKNKKIKLIKNKKNFGPAKTRNIGINKSKGEIIFFTDSDCYVPKNWIEKILEEYQEEKVAGVGGFLKPKENTWVAKFELLQNKFLLGIKNKKITGGSKTPMGYTNNVSYRKKILNEVEGFDESFPSPAGEDIDLKKRICKKGYRVVYIPLPVIHLDDYNFDYLLKRIVVKGSNKSLPKNKILKFLYSIIILPYSIFNLFVKIIKYKMQNLI
jgi:glycosyltransferase involved in cell wall biosynthesis